MADNTNQQAINFDVNKIRPVSDMFYGLYLHAKNILALWNVNSANFPNDTGVIIDGAATDGKIVITNAALINIVNRCQDFVNYMEGSQTISANDGSKAVLNTVLAVQVNGDKL